MENSDRIHYELLCVNGIWLRVGDGVYIEDEVTGVPKVYRCDRFWRDLRVRDGAFASGTWLARPIGGFEIWGFGLNFVVQISSTNHRACLSTRSCTVWSNRM